MEVFFFFASQGNFFGLLPKSQPFVPLKLMLLPFIRDSSAECIIAVKVGHLLIKKPMSRFL